MSRTRPAGRWVFLDRLLSCGSMRLRVWPVFMAAALCAAWLAISVSPAAAASGRKRSAAAEKEEQPPSQGLRVPCDQVMSAVHREVTRSKGRSADLTLVARRFGTSVSWVERCLQASGKRSERPGVESAEGREERLEKFEEEEPEEVLHEDVSEPGTREQAPRREKERSEHAKPPPTPDEYGRVRGE